MRRFLILLSALALAAFKAAAQRNVVQNRPYTDLRQFHFGVVVGAHLQDIELLNAGPQALAADDGSAVERIVTCDQDRWDAGFTVGVLGELRLNSNLAFRIAPAMYFGTRRLRFVNLTETQADGQPASEKQELKTVYISTAADLIFAAKRLNNVRPYVMTGLNPMLNLSGKDSDILRLKRHDLFFEVGVGCDLYLPFFKLRPELKFCYSLINSLDAGHASRLKDKNMLVYTRSVKDTRTKIIALSFYFE